MFYRQFKFNKEKQMLWNEILGPTPNNILKLALHSKK